MQIKKKKNNKNNPFNSIKTVRINTNIKLEVI